MDDLDRREADILETFEDLLCGVCGLWDEVVRRGTRIVGTTGQELKTGTANTVRNSNGASELYAEAMLVTQRVWMHDIRTHKSPNETLCANAKGMNCVYTKWDQNGRCQLSHR